MPDYWYDIRKCIIHDDDDEETKKQKEQNIKLVAANKPYFMTYVYPSLRTDNNSYIKNNNDGAVRRFFEYGIHSLDDLYAYEPKTPEMIEYLKYYEKFLPVGNNPCVVNRISWLFERELDSYISKKYEQPDFDYTIMKSNIGYSSKSFKEIKAVYEKYLRNIDSFQYSLRKNKIDKDSYDSQRQMCIDEFKRQCEIICTNEKELCDIVLDLCYQTSQSKRFAWDICGDVILDNLLEQHNYLMSIPVQVDSNGDFTYCGQEFEMQQIKIGGDEE